MLELNRVPHSAQLLEFLPSSIQSISLKSNTLERFPDELSRLVNLTFLDISSNEIQSIPGSYTSLSHLDTLDVSFVFHN